MSVFAFIDQQHQHIFRMRFAFKYRLATMCVGGCRSEKMYSLHPGGIQFFAFWYDLS